MGTLGKRIRTGGFLAVGLFLATTLWFSLVNASGIGITVSICSMVIAGVVVRLRIMSGTWDAVVTCAIALGLLSISVFVLATTGSARTSAEFHSVILETGTIYFLYGWLPLSVGAVIVPQRIPVKPKKS